MAVENLFVARRNCSRPPGPISSAPGLTGVGRGSFLVRLFSFGLIIQNKIEIDRQFASLNFCSRFAQRTRSCPAPPLTFGVPEQVSDYNTRNTRRKCPRPKERKSLCRFGPRSRGNFWLSLQRSALLLESDSHMRRN